VSPVVDIALRVLASIALWAAGTVVFDFVHWILHAMLRSRWRLVRALAWPHAVHHRWLDDGLEIHWDLQTRNIFCHIVPEYLTQVAFSAAMLLVLPVAIVIGCFAIQTVVFIGLLCYRGLDINHRPIAVLDAHRPSIFAPPAYHALHHVHPDSYFSAYGKIVDLLVGGGCAIAGRRFHLGGGDAQLRETLRNCLKRRGAQVVEAGADGTPADPRGDDVLILLPAADPAAAPTETFLARCAHDQLPGEVWDLRRDVDLAEMRFYERDPRVIYRRVSPRSGENAEELALRALFWLRRGLHHVPASWRDAAIERRRWRATAPHPPTGAPWIRSRKELAAGG